VFIEQTRRAPHHSANIKAGVYIVTVYETRVGAVRRGDKADRQFALHCSTVVVVVTAILCRRRVANDCVCDTNTVQQRYIAYWLLYSKRANKSCQRPLTSAKENVVWIDPDSVSGCGLRMRITSKI